jgi:predicted nucleic acid-binding protein
MIVVLDAGVALKWQFEGEDVIGGATALLEDFVENKIELISLTLFPYEILSAINVAINRRRIEEEAGYRAIHYITSLRIELRGFGNLVDSTFYMARRYGLSPHDCAYMALAEKEKCDFFTGDKKLFNSIKQRLSWVKWIGDYHSSANSSN